ncbi:AmmeMemoRadiSam system radical SAM enzyme [Geomobilimonas luticola]|uniref:AmmeMemoRadiSam system radical SAM enzyme n=1 Tax=Geomobilimonas luticola TaxID=1114878 RepID=A0ABS5SF46_9BACT|nr:AmmeMemoRadiSam system radical SAM enzyme [Geomobilimonas luticola]MBT0653993.1 AmmeMemoRadiSam system radical SAM enzyme [Geomobilimonas luticola]
MREAMFYEKVTDGKVRCGLCRFRCLIADGGCGICGVRENRSGTLYTLVYGKAVAEHVDPIEKKPLFHFLPGSRSFSLATVGCNFRCLHCQNYAISQPTEGKTLRITGSELPPALIVEKALAAGCRSISYTYTEPTIFFEYAYDTAVLAHRAGLKNVFVTNGYITAEALAHIRPYLDAANIDLKGFSDRFYREVVHAMLAEVLASVLEYKRSGVWIELTTLIIPGWNDADEELRGIARFIADEVGVDTPWHVSQFYPTFKLTDRPRTPVATLRRARQIGLDAGLRYVYEGNVPGEGGENTFCPGCGELVIRRVGYTIADNGLRKGACPHCTAELAGVWE